MCKSYLTSETPVVTYCVFHATNNFTWVSDLVNLYWTLTLTHLTIIITCNISWLLAQYFNTR
jgi:hypothetical protein